jgi:cutinase
MLSASDSAFVKSAVIFGDPNNGDAVGKVSAGNTKVICHTGDLICAGQAVILAPHLTYGADAGTAAAFVMSTAGAAAAGAATGGAAAGGAGGAGAGGAGAGGATAATKAAKGTKGAKKTTRTTARQFVS